MIGCACSERDMPWDWQVLSKALDVWGLEIIPMHSPAMAAVRDHPEAEAAFICNLQEHWFTVRAIFGDWWNFNSLFPAPQHLSSFYLSAFLGSLKEQGYTIFVVRGELPAAQPPADVSSHSDGPGVWVTPEQVCNLAHNDRIISVPSMARTFEVTHDSAFSKNLERCIMRTAFTHNMCDCLCHMQHA